MRLFIALAALYSSPKAQQLYRTSRPYPRCPAGCPRSPAATSSQFKACTSNVTNLRSASAIFWRLSASALQSHSRASKDAVAKSRLRTYDAAMPTAREHRNMEQYYVRVSRIPRPNNGHVDHSRVPLPLTSPSEGVSFAFSEHIFVQSNSYPFGNAGLLEWKGCGGGEA